MKDRRLTRRQFLEVTSAGAALLATGCGGLDPESDVADAALGPASSDGAPKTLPYDAEPLRDGEASESESPDGGTDDGRIADGPTAQCEETADNILGPFYRAGAPFRSDINALGEAGTLLIVNGLVVGPDCKTPIPGALVDVWQANPNGSYDNDTSDFQLRGRMYANSYGIYQFSTIVPGNYGSGDDLRPKHIHLKATADGFVDLTTQIYFAGDPYLDTDPFVVASLITPVVAGKDVDLMTFNIVLAGS